MCLPKLPYPKQRRSCNQCDFSVKIRFSFGCISGSFWHLFLRVFRRYVRVFNGFAEARVSSKNRFSTKNTVVSSILSCYLHPWYYLHRTLGFVASCCSVQPGLRLPRQPRSIYRTSTFLEPHSASIHHHGTTSKNIISVVKHNWCCSTQSPFNHRFLRKMLDASINLMNVHIG